MMEWVEWFLNRSLEITEALSSTIPPSPRIGVDEANE